MPIKEQTVYTTSDGKKFDNFGQARRHEDRIEDKAEQRKQTVIARITQKYELDDYAIWEVRGEDENADFSGPHYNPLIGHFEGTLNEVIDIVHAHPRFFTWGHGGTIEKVSVVKIS